MKRLRLFLGTLLIISLMLVSTSASPLAGADQIPITGAQPLVAGTIAGSVTTRIAVAWNGGQGNGSSAWPSISSDGRFVAFHSSSSNLVPNDINASEDIFVRDRQTGQTELISVASDGTQGMASSSFPAISPDGRFVTFDSFNRLVPGDTNIWGDAFLRDRQTSQIEWVSIASNGTQPNNPSYAHSISSDGRFVALWSSASNLHPLDPDMSSDVFLRDRQAGQTELLSVSTAGTHGNSSSLWPSMSADGRLVAFESAASNLVAGDSNALADIFVRDRQTGQTERVSIATDGTQANGHSSYPSISADGRYAAFESNASNPVGGDTNLCTDLFVRDRQTGQTRRVSVASDGTQGNGQSQYSQISADGRFVAFSSFATNLAPGSPPYYTDVIVHELAADPSVAIVGYANLEGRADPAPHPSYQITVTLNLLQPSSETSTDTSTAVTDMTGRSTVTGPLAGTYDLRLKGSHTLSRKVASRSISRGSNAITWTQALREGDANGDNYVTITDFGILRTAFGKGSSNAGFDPRADFNQDGFVTIADFSLLRGNFGQAGE